MRSRVRLVRPTFRRRFAAADGDRWRLTGTKRFVLDASIAERFSVAARNIVGERAIRRARRA